MADWALNAGGARWLEANVDTANSRGTQITSGAANTKGSYTVLVASTPEDAFGIMVHIGAQPATADCLVDIGIGASTAERPLIPDLRSSAATGATGVGYTYYFPIYIPAGARLTARSQSTTASGVVNVQVHLMYGKGFGRGACYSQVTAYGAVTASSRGTSIDPGAVANTEGSWAQLVASTANPIALACVAFGNNGDWARAAAQAALVDIGIGAAAAEREILRDFYIACDSSKDNWAPPVTPLLPLWVPAASRLAARARCSVTTAGDRTLDVIVYGVN